ncbi:hypothetical protein [Mahella australiensis]|uniref:Uncharacterized protein n=1 Tax=Mahella australiensis (strain DSM 15567 / CIP 107919 / 50-1 BON) TaxID=697281 RepID=F3ZWY5_MAHA5|nr:hypothetical protein [Mahella australiensis]AEE97607.1 hypothetical protein Mahau_2446 [Mahella australiensis 50-1 BON]
MKGIYNISLFGFDFAVYFSKHAIKRCTEREVLPGAVIAALEGAEDGLGDTVKDNQYVVVHDGNQGISFVAQFHCRYEPSIDIMTVLDSADMVPTKQDDAEVWVPVQESLFNFAGTTAK